MVLKYTNTTRERRDEQWSTSTTIMMNLQDRFRIYPIWRQRAQSVLDGIRQQSKGFASRRSLDYLDIRRSLEQKAPEALIAKGGRPVRQFPHYMTLGSCPWLLE